LEAKEDLMNLCQDMHKNFRETPKNSLKGKGCAVPSSQAYNNFTYANTTNLQKTNSNTKMNHQ
jgi:hypothetical protein